MCIQNSCPVCLEMIEVSDATWLPCCHSFHATCIKHWTRHHSTCPTYRIDIFSNEWNDTDDEGPPPLEEDTDDEGPPPLEEDIDID